MAKFQIMTPGGYEVEVQADTPEAAIEKARASWETMPRIVAKDGDTRVFERPNGQRYVVSPGFSTTDPKRVEQVMQKIGTGRAAQEVSQQSIDEGILAQNPVTSRLSQFVRGTPFVGSYADEAIGAVAGPEAAAGTRALQAAQQRQRPGETLGLNLAGGLTAAAGAAAAAPSALGGLGSAAVGQGSRLSQIGRGIAAGAGAGALEGAVYGAGEGTDAASRAAQAGLGAGVGAGVGGLIGGAAPVVRDAASNVIGLFRRSDVNTVAKEFGISKEAAIVVKNAFEMGDDIDAAIAQVKKAGDLGLVGDAGEAAQSLLDAVAASGPSGARAVKGPLEQRVTQSAQKLDTQLTGLLGQPAEGPKTAVAAIQKATAPARREAYQAAFDTPIDYAAQAGRNIESALDRVDSDVLMKAITEANAEMKSLGLTNQQIMAMIGDDGKVVFREMPNARQVNEVKKALDAAARDARNPLTGVETQQSMRYSRLAGELRDALVEATGGDQGTYAQALKLGGDTVKEREAFLLGESLLSPKTRVEDVNLDLSDFLQVDVPNLPATMEDIVMGRGRNARSAQLQAVRSGLRTRIEEIVGNVRRIPSDPNIDARQMLATLREMGSDNAREKIRRVMGPEAEQLIAALDEAAVAAETRAATAVNSRTKIRDATQQGVEAMTAPGVVGQLAQGEPINASKEIVKAITGATSEYTETQRQRIYQDVAKALTQKQGPEARAALAVLKRAIEGQKLTEAQTEQLANLLATSLFATATPAAARGAAQEYQ